MDSLWMKMPFLCVESFHSVSPSCLQPSGDGYKWKYLSCNLKDENLQIFLKDQHIMELIFSVVTLGLFHRTAQKSCFEAIKTLWFHLLRKRYYWEHNTIVWFPKRIVLTQIFIYVKIYDMLETFWGTIQNLYTSLRLINPCLTICIIRRWDCRSKLIFE